MSAPLALVTGGLGFLGAELCRVLLEQGQRVRVLDDGSRGSVERLGTLRDRVEVRRGDVRDEDAVARATEGARNVFHLAAINGTRRFYEAPDEVFEVGMLGTLHVLRAARAAGVARVVLASSSEVYATPPVIPTPEDVPLVVPSLENPRFSYGGSKIASELMALHLGVRRGLHVVIVRPHNVYGPDMGDDHVIPELSTRIARLAARSPERPVRVEIEGDGSETRAFCYVSDAAEGLWRLGSSAPSGAVLHLGTEEEISISELATRIAAQLGIEVTLVPSARRAGSPTRRCPAIDAARALGWGPTTSLASGLERTVSWYAARARR